MTMSLEEFRASLSSAERRGALGLPLTDVEAQQVADDASSTQSWYSYWLSTQPAQPTPPPPAGPAYDAPPPPAGPAYDAPPPPAGPAYDAPPPASVASPQPAPTHPIPDAQATAVLPEGVGAPASAPIDPAFAATAAYPGYEGQPGAFAAYPDAGAAAGGEAPRKKRVGLWVTLSIVGALLLIAAIVVVFAFATARHWTKTDVPEQPETFHSEEYETGRYDVTMDEVNPCTVNQDWTDCTNLMVATYTAACADVELTETASLLCADYSDAIAEMKAQDGDGYYVATLGTYGTLHQTPEIDTRQVSNDDYKPAVTHEAVCYLEFIGECE